MHCNTSNGMYWFVNLYLLCLAAYWWMLILQKMIRPSFSVHPPIHILHALNKWSNRCRILQCAPCTDVYSQVIVRVAAFLLGISLFPSALFRWLTVNSPLSSLLRNFTLHSAHLSLSLFFLNCSYISFDLEHSACALLSVSQNGFFQNKRTFLSPHQYPL